MSRFLFRRQARRAATKTNRNDDFVKSLRVGMPNEPGMWDLG